MSRRNSGYFVSHPVNSIINPLGSAEAEQSLSRKVGALAVSRGPRDLPARCQLPDEIPVGTHGNVIRRPEAWR